MENELILAQSDLEEWFYTEDDEEFFDEWAKKYCQMLEDELGEGWSVDYSKYVVQKEVNGLPLRVCDEDIREEVLDAMYVVRREIF